MDDQNMQGMPADASSDEETKNDGMEKPEEGMEGAEGAEEPKEEGQM